MCLIYKNNKSKAQLLPDNYQNIRDMGKYWNMATVDCVHVTAQEGDAVLHARNLFNNIWNNCQHKCLNVK